MDADLESLSREQLIAEVKRLRQAFANIATAPGTSCAGTIPRCGRCCRKKSDPLPVVPDWPQFLRGCLRYRQSLDDQLPQAPRSHEPYRD